MKRSLLLTALLSMVLPLTARGQTSVELISGRSQVTGSHGHNTSFGVRVRHQRARDIWYLGVSHESAFGDDGWLGNISNTHTFNDKWSSHLSATTSMDAFFLPRYRFDAQLARRFGPKRVWQVTGSAMTRAAQDEHRDVGAGVGVFRFLPGGFAAETSVFWTHTSPEDIVTRRHHVGVMWFGRGRELSARVGFGKESYMPIRPDSTMVAFNSYDVTGRWVEPISATVAVAITGTYYDNPHYRGTGYSVGVVKRLGR
jgi:YaiO family outer membrane protein